MTLVLALGAALVFLVAPFTGAPSAQAAPPDPLDCTGTVYSTGAIGDRPVVGLSMSTIGSSGTVTAVTEFETPSNATGLNGLGVGAGGEQAYFVGTVDGAVNAFTYTAATGVIDATPLPVGIAPGVGGAVNPLNGLYYFGSVLAGGPLNVFDPATGAIVQVGVMPAENGTDGNGDFGFSAQGDLFVVAGSTLVSFPAASIPSVAGTAVLSGATVISQGSFPLGNGIAFDGDGFLYVQSNDTVASTIRRVSPVTGQVIGVPTTSDVPGTDLATCATPPTLSLQKSVAGRVSPTDQFTLSIAASSTLSATTTGTDDGLQAEDVGPTIGVPGTVFTLSETAAGTTDLSRYRSTYECVDVAHGNQLIASGAGSTFALTYPPANAQSIVCTFTNEELIPALSIMKASDATADARPGDTVTYTVAATNTGDGDYTTTNPAVVFDDLSNVLDDAIYNTDAVSDQVGQVAFSSPLLSWTGALVVGATVTLTYSVTLESGGDGTVRNVAWAPSDPEQTAPPLCDPPEGGLDPTTGEPCAEAEFLLPRLTVEKTADRTELPVVGASVTYTITVTNAGPGVFTAAAPATATDDLTGVLDAADFNDDAVASTGSLAYDEPTLTWSGALGANESATITYTVTYTAEGDQTLRNVVCAPPGTGVPGAPDCDVVQIPGAGLTQWKQVRSSATPAVAGTVLTYTLFFSNDGQAGATVDAVDDLTHVLDDAEVTTEPSSADGLAVTRAGDRISITGSVPSGETYAVTYQITIRADGTRGDDIASNYLLAPDEEPPADPACTPADEQFPDCTTTPIAAVEYAKSVSASSDPVVAGTILTYTVTVTSTGAATVPVAREDVMVDVLDDADLTSEPSSDTATVTVSDVVDGRFQLGGELAAGLEAVITYTVTVVGDADRGNNTADNFLVPPGAEPPTECAVGDTSCTVTPMPLIAVEKTADPVTGSDVQAGQVVIFTLTFGNSGTATGAVDYSDDLSEVLDDADVTAAPTSSDPALTPTSVADGVLQITGTLAAGQTVSVSYAVTVRPDGDRGDNLLRNVLAETGTDDPQCGDDGVECTEHPIGELDDWKTVDPATGATLRRGQTVTYTLHFENTGSAPVSVSRDDVLTQVLDDADVTAQPQPSSDALAVSAISGGRFTITGTVAPGGTVTVTYTVTVRSDGQRGDDRLDNFLVPNGETPPEGPCIPADDERPDCTFNHVSDVTVAKSSDPSTGSAVNPGDSVTYTLTFTNRGTNPDAADVAIDYTDHMSGVLDDTTLVSGPIVSFEQLTAVRGGDSIRVTGAVPTGQTYTVVYAVTVNAYAEQGDHELANVVAITGEPPVCAPGSSLCTSHIVPPPAPPAPAGGLPGTGGEISDAVIAVAVLLLGLGSGLVLVARRRIRS